MTIHCDDEDNWQANTPQSPLKPVPTEGVSEMTLDNVIFEAVEVITDFEAVGQRAAALVTAEAMLAAMMSFEGPDAHDILQQAIEAHNNK